MVKSLHEPWKIMKIYDVSWFDVSWTTPRWVTSLRKFWSILGAILCFIVWFMAMLICDIGYWLFFSKPKKQVVYAQGVYTGPLRPLTGAQFFRAMAIGFSIWSAVVIGIIFTYYYPILGCSAVILIALAFRFRHALIQLAEKSWIAALVLVIYSVLIHVPCSALKRLIFEGNLGHNNRPTQSR